MVRVSTNHVKKVTYCFLTLSTTFNSKFTPRFSVQTSIPSFDMILNFLYPLSLL